MPAHHRFRATGILRRSRGAAGTAPGGEALASDLPIATSLPLTSIQRKVDRRLAAPSREAAGRRKASVLNDMLSGAFMAARTCIPEGEEQP